MRNTLEDLYYGNIAPNTQDIAPNSELKRATDRVARVEKQLEEMLDETGRMILTKLVRTPLMLMSKKIKETTNLCMGKGFQTVFLSQI